MNLTESYTNDVFRIWFYKRILCARKEKHEWAACAFAHPGERANRRDPRCHGPALCHEQEKTGECPMGDQCPSAHSVFESWLHPRKYRTQMCSDAPHCTRNLCFFAHNADELRQNTSIPPCPPEYDKLMAKSAATTTSSGGRHGQHASQAHQPGHHNRGASIANSAAAGAVSGYSTHPSSTGGGQSAPPSPYYAAGTRLQLRSSDDGSSTSIQQQNGRSRRGLAGGGAASPSAATAGHQQSVPGIYINTAPIQAAPVVPIPAPPGFNAAAAATYTPPYPVNANAMAAAAYAPSAGYMPPVRSSEVSNSSSTATDAAQPQPQPQPPQRQGTGVYVPVAARFSGAGSSGNHGGYTAGTPNQQLQAAASWYGSTRGRTCAGESTGNTSRSSAGAGQRPMHTRQQQQHELAKLSPQHSTQLLADTHIADEEEGIKQFEETGDAAYSAATEQSQEPHGHTPSRQSSAAAATAAATAALSAPADSSGPSQQHTDKADRIPNSQPQLHIRLPADEVFHQTSNDLHDAAAAALAAGTAVGGTETKLRKTREMLKAALSELSAMRARTQAAEARMAAAESYMTKAALQAYAAAEETAKMQANKAAAAGKPDLTEDATATGEAGAFDAAVAQAGASSATHAVATDSMAATSDDAQSKDTGAPGEPAAQASVAAEGGETASRVALQQDTTEATNKTDAEAQGAAATAEDDAVELSELMPVSCTVLSDSRMLVTLPKAMTPRDVGSLLRAAMARAGANELQVRTADVILHAQLVAMREAQAESRLMQTELDSARKAAQQAAGERDKFEVKYRSYKLASRQHASEVTSLQQQVKKAQAHAEEARASAANAWALVKQAQKQGAVNWADAMSEGDGEGVDDQDQTEAAAVQSVPAN